MTECSFHLLNFECNKYSTVVNNEKILSKTIENLRVSYNKE